MAARVEIDAVDERIEDLARQRSELVTQIEKLAEEADSSPLGPVGIEPTTWRLVRRGWLTERLRRRYPR